MQVDLDKYQQFVEGVTSKDSEFIAEFQTRLTTLSNQNNDVNVPLLLTAGLGLAGESGEFADIIKKCLFHGKELSPELRTKLAFELGDVMWYWINACRALNLDPNQVIADNVTKLSARYPGGVFSVERSENRDN